MSEAPPTDEGWFVLHDFRTVDWEAWRDAPEREREQAIAEGTTHLRRHEEVADSDEGASAVFSVLGHKADLLVVHFRPTLDDLSRAERAFEQTALASFTGQPMSYVSVTEISGYSTPEYFEDPDAVDEGLKNYMEGKLKPEIPNDEYVSFYPMSKRRGETHNWYDTDFSERAEMMETHAETGKEYAGKIKQVIASSVGFDDYEWGVTLFSDDPTHIKDIVYEMRFDDVSSKYGEFGRFYVGRRFPPADLGAYLEGEAVPTSEHGDAEGHSHGEQTESDESSEEHDHDDGDEGADEDSIRAELSEMDIYGGQPHGEDVYATVLYSEADTDELFDEVEGLRGNFEHYGTHVKTAVYEARNRDRSAVVSIWDTASAAETAAGFLSELPDVVSRAGEESGFGTMGMFYTVKSDYREEFHDTFDTVGEVLSGMDGHQETDLLVNVEDENDMFISSQWDSRENAMAFFRSEDFSEAVEWGRDVLADRPRHVFLA
ncbi:MAG: heme-binding protein [Halobellus sp.]|uniref:heme-binding protein n=1 Tax=Halobellus sp. TaxID=1979212 RepID=UPI0035D43DAE